MFIACFSAEGQLKLKTLPEDTSKVYEKKEMLSEALRRYKYTGPDCTK